MFLKLLVKVNDMEKKSLLNRVSETIQRSAFNAAVIVVSTGYFIKLLVSK